MNIHRRFPFSEFVLVKDACWQTRSQTLRRCRSDSGSGLQNDLRDALLLLADFDNIVWFEHYILLLALFDRVVVDGQYFAVF